MHIDQFLKQTVTAHPAKGSRGKESDWLDFYQLQVKGKSMWIGDANFVPHEEDGFLVAVDTGNYLVTAKAIDFGGDKRVSRLRVCLHGVEAELGGKIGETWTDTAITGICDHETFSEAWGDDDDASDAIIRPTLDDYCDGHGVALLNDASGAVMPFVDSGFGDGTFPVFELSRAGRRSGFEIQFIENDAPYPF